MKNNHFIDRSFAYYMLFGIINTSITTVVIIVLYNLWHWGYWPSTAIGYGLGNISSFILNRYITFKYKGNLLRTAVKFALSAAASYLLAYLIATPIVTAVMGHFCWDSFLTEELIKIAGEFLPRAFIEDRITGNISIIIGGIMYCFINYAGQKYIVFRDSEKK